MVERSLAEIIGWTFPDGAPYVDTAGHYRISVITCDDLLRWLMADRDWCSIGNVYHDDDLWWSVQVANTTGDGHNEPLEFVDMVQSDGPTLFGALEAAVRQVAG
jgi:hypothetical protein